MDYLMQSGGCGRKALNLSGGRHVLIGWRCIVQSIGLANRYVPQIPKKVRWCATLFLPKPTSPPSSLSKMRCISKRIKVKNNI
jgi:hypothetical protein